MPLLAYFVGVGTILVGLLFVAEAQLGPAKPKPNLFAATGAASGNTHRVW